MFGTRLLLLSQLTARHWSGECAPLVAGYKSAISLDKLYPKSKLDPLANVEGLFTTTASNSTGTSDDQKFTGFIPINKLQITNISCSKPGGQKVNKIKSGVEIRFHLESCDWIPSGLKEKIRAKINNINKDGFLIVRSEKTRTALLNQADCLERIRTMVHEAAIVPKGLSEEDKLKIEIDKKIADGRRLVDKRRESEKRALRRHPIYDAQMDFYWKK